MSTVLETPAERLKCAAEVANKVLEAIAAKKRLQNNRQTRAADGGGRHLQPKHQSVFLRPMQPVGIRGL
jgi:hypothetical protein